MRGWGGLAVATMLVAWPALAQTVARVGVEGDSPDNPARVKVVEELRSQGYDVREPGEEQDANNRPLTARLIVLGRRIEVRVVVRRRGQYERREAVIELGQTDDEQTTAALRAAEFLRVSLLDLGADVPARPEAPGPSLALEDKPRKTAVRTPQPHVPQTPMERTSAIGLSVGGALGFSSGGFSAQPWLAIALVLPVSSSARARVFGMIPISSPSSKAPEGEIRLGTTLFGPSLAWAALRGQSAELELEAGVAAVSVSISGKANPGPWSESSTRYAAMPLAGARLLVLPGRFRIGLGGFAGTLLPREQAKASGREVATWGAFVGAGTLQLEVALD